MEESRKRKKDGEQVEGQREPKRKKVACGHCFVLNKAKNFFCCNCGTKIREREEVVNEREEARVREENQLQVVPRVRGDNHSPYWMIIDHPHVAESTDVSIQTAVIGQISQVYANLLGNEPINLNGRSFGSVWPKDMDTTPYIQGICRETKNLSGCYTLTQMGVVFKTLRKDLYKIVMVKFFYKKNQLLY